MKQFTKKFFKNEAKDEGFDAINQNAKSAEKKIFLPSELWIELTNKFNKSKLKGSLFDIGITTAFMAGVAVGWAEKNNKVK